MSRIVVTNTTSLGRPDGGRRMEHTVAPYAAIDHSARVPSTTLPTTRPLTRSDPPRAVHVNRPVCQWQAQAPPQPPARGIGAGALAAGAAPVLANTDSRRTAPGWPCGHVAGSLASLIGRRTSKVSSQVRQRNS